MKKLMTILLSAALPAAAMAQPAPQILQTRDFVTPPGSAVAGVAHVDEVRIGERREIHAYVMTNDDFAELTFDGRTIVLGDGYSVARETLANTRGIYVARLTASSPDGSSASMIIVADRSTGEVSNVAGERYATLLRGSHDTRVINQVLPFVLTQPHTSDRWGMAAMGSDCLSAALAFASATLGVELACASPAPGACEIALSAWVLAVNNLAQSCPSTSYDDGTIGWG